MASVAATAAADSSSTSEGGRTKDDHKIQNERQTGRSRVRSSIRDNGLIGAATKATAEQGAALIDSCVTYFGKEIEANRR